MRVTVIDYGRSNLLSVCRALCKLGAQPLLAQTAEDVLAAQALVLPGVGAFADGMASLKQAGLCAPIIQKARGGTPLLGICLGMQMLFDESEEGGTHKGLGLIPGRVERLPGIDIDGKEQPVPNIGWCALTPAGGRKDFSGTAFAGLAKGAQCYFVHSYEAKPEHAHHRLADILYGGRPVCAAVQNANVVGCQFHPEKSARAGLAVLQSFLLLAQHAT